MINDLLFSNKRLGKVALQEQQWATLKCEDCGGKLAVETDNEFECVKVCQCGLKAVLIKKKWK